MVKELAVGLNVVKGNQDHQILILSIWLIYQWERMWWKNPNRYYDIIVMETEPAARKEGVKVTQDDLSIS